MKTNLIYITAGSQEEAENIAQEIVANRLAACAKIISQVSSYYWWEGEIQNDREVVIIAKTQESLVPPLIEKVKSVHSYDCPCIVSLPILDGNTPFLEWVQNETQHQAT